MTITWKITVRYNDDKQQYLIWRNDWCKDIVYDYDTAVRKLRQLQKDEAKGETILLEETKQ